MTGSTEARTSRGTVTGTLETNGVCRFSAIPYAAAPIGSLRWQPPAPAEWQDRLDATRPGPIAPQLPSRLREAMGDINAPQSEDCLNLTVWTPAADGKKRPVLIWLHGGAWQSGAGAIAWYSGAHLAALGDIVVVSPNYRLGALGWLYVPGQTANVGLLDQEAAIAWVIANAESFGGDPSNITVMGQSAGAGSITCMLAREPRFKRTILQSTPLGRGLRNANQAAHLGQVFLEATGADSVDAARNLPAEVFLKAQQAPAVMAALKAEGSGRSLFGPVADGKVLPSHTAHGSEGMKAAAGKVDVIIGSTAEEMRSFPGAPAGAAGRALGDQLFGAPSLQWAKNAAAAGRSAWVYRFDYAPSEAFGACHCIELPFVFGTLDAYAGAPMLHGLDPEHAVQLSRDMQSAWIAFIKGDSPPWQPATPSSDNLRIFG
ncbi:MAG: carboxylesterase family protein [Polaromonas sp.]|uniref:carboxylesterase/lipase family protein n=1 Tax=Polaromonas sp. TaxID=1869339 RepID=UPI002735A7C1|nr:carboxylesterase family protein [Polaromonas sp.]MDP3799257.1 carboxylesterase family protein [Polaromonas sp.]